jgi:hypothetical protein
MDFVVDGKVANAGPNMNRSKVIAAKTHTFAFFIILFRRAPNIVLLKTSCENTADSFVESFYLCWRYSLVEWVASSVWKATKGLVRMIKSQGSPMKNPNIEVKIMNHGI